MKKRTIICVLTPVAIGVVLVVVASVIYTKVFPKVIVEKIDEELVLKNNTASFDRFVDLGVPTYMKFYFFNVSNKDEVNENGAKPILQEVGPYVYRKHLERHVTKLDDDQGTVLYTEVPTYYFEPEMSNGTQQDQINHVNFVSIAMVNSTRLDLLQSITKTNKSEMIENTPGQLVETHGADDLIFQGFDFREYLPPFNHSALSVSTVCKFVDNCLFAFFLNKNNTDSKSYEVKTGAPPANSSESLVESMKYHREIVTYDGERNLSYWRGESCNMLNGTDGTQFPPGVDKRKGLYIFTTEVCRSLYLEYAKDETVQGMGAYRYVMPASGYASPLVNPDNWCFVPENTPKELLSLGGALPVAPCYDGYPIMASAPHFYMADQKYRDAFEGLKPEQSLHESFLDVEPMTGTTISAAKRLQISIRIDPDSRPKFLKFINQTIAFPIFWAEEAGNIDEKNRKMLNDNLFTPYKAVKWTLVAAMALGCLVLIVVLLVYVKTRNTKKNHPPHQDVSGVAYKNGHCSLNNFHRTMEQSHIPTLELNSKTI